MKDWPQHKIEEKVKEREEPTPAQPKLYVRSTPPFKLRQKDGKHIQGINIAKQFGFMPEVLIFERLLIGKNEFVVRAILNDEEIAKAQKLEADNKK